jgi:hypothetical protein
VSGVGKISLKDLSLSERISSLAADGSIVVENENLTIFSIFGSNRSEEAKANYAQSNN